MSRWILFIAGGLSLVFWLLGALFSWVYKRSFTTTPEKQDMTAREFESGQYAADCATTLFYRLSIGLAVFCVGLMMFAS